MTAVSKSLKAPPVYMCTQALPVPNHGKTHGNERGSPTTPAQTDITGDKLVRRYTIPSSTIVLPENKVPYKTHRTSARAGTTHPQT